MNRYLKISLLFLLCISFYEKVLSQNSESGLRIMFYNVENFFDIYNDSLTDDDDFLPEGVMRWNYSKYSNKLNSLYKTIIAAGEWEPPAIIGFCEIEKKKILEDLIYDTYLSKFKYSVIHEESPDRRGIDVCLIYRKEKARLIDYEYWVPPHKVNIVFNSRSVLYARFLLGTDSLNLIVNHWPSRRGGVLEGESNKLSIAELIRGKIDSIFDTNSNAKIVVCGDFNCTPYDNIVKSLIYSPDPGRILINLSDSLENTGAGTYRYMGTWEMIDQVMININLLSSKDGFYTRKDQLKIFKTDFLMKRDPKYPGFSPFPTYRGYQYQGGFSDHLPILLDLMLR